MNVTSIGNGKQMHGKWKLSSCKERNIMGHISEYGGKGQGHVY